MSRNATLCVGTIGSGAWVSPDGGESWRRVMRGLWSESRVFNLSVHPAEPRTVFAGADDGVYKSQDGGQSFERLESPMNSLDVWRIAFDPSDPDTIFAGTRPAALYRSRDGGRHWHKLAAEMAEECPNVRVPRVTALTVDPQDRRVVWAGVEVDGVRRSLDGGDTWTRIGGGLDDPDIHDVMVRAAGNRKTVLTSTPREIFASTDRGESWQGLGVASNSACPIAGTWHCGRTTRTPSLSRPATGRRAAPARSSARPMAARPGGHWPLPAVPNSPIWAFATHPADAGLIYACSHYGELYATADAGDSWRKLPREFTEIRALSWTPN